RWHDIGGRAGYVGREPPSGDQRHQDRRRNGELRIAPQYAWSFKIWPRLAWHRRRGRVHGLHCHQNIPPCASSSERSFAAQTAKRSVLITESSRGRGRLMVMTSAIVPGRAVIAITRSERKIASAIEWVMKITVLPLLLQIRINSRFICSRVMASSAPKGSSISRRRGS